MCSRSRLARPLAFVLVALLAVIACSDGDGERGLERRLLAPCCWRQNLEDHDSDLARQLRNEIHARLAAGDTPDTIEADLARRYGDEIRVRTGGWAIEGASLAALGAGLFVAFTWFRRRRRAPEDVAIPAESDELADRLDDELCDVD